MATEGNETYVLVPVSFNQGPCLLGSPRLALVKCRPDTRALRDLHLQMVIYAKTYNTDGFVPDYEVGRLAYPDPIPVALRDAQRLAEAGVINAVEGGFYVPAAEDWPSLYRTGTRDPIPDLIRKHVYERDGWRCVECGSTENLTLDHVIPWSKNGSDKEENLRTLCVPCNSRKGARV